MATDGSILCNIGVPYPLAAEIGRQMTAGQGNAVALCALGLNAGPAVELANQITLSIYSAHRLALAMWNPTQAEALKALGNANSGSVSIIDEQFTTGQYSPGPITSDLVDTRSTIKYVTDTSGVLHQIGINGLPISNAGLLFEPTAATNKLLQSGDLSNGSWLTSTTGSGTLTITGNAGVAPDGTTTAAKITVGRSATADRAYRYQNLTATAASHAMSIYVVAFAAGDVGKEIAFELYNGTSTVATITVLLTAAYQRVVLSGLLTTSAGNNFGMGFVDAIGSQTGTVNFLAAFAQGELGSTASSYIPTTTAAASRSADSIQIQRSGIGTLVLTYTGGATSTIYPNASGNFTLAPADVGLITRMTGVAATAPLRQVASTVALSNKTFSAAQAMSRQPMTCMYRADSLKIVIPNSSVETNNGGTLTATASVEYPAGVYTPFKFSGSTTGVTSGMFLTSDELSVSIPAAAAINIKIWGSSSNSVFSSPNNYSVGTFSDGGACQTGATVTDSTLTGAAITNTADGIMLCATVLAARHKSRATACIGDSICAGAGNTGGVSGESPNAGLFAPALRSVIATANYGYPGDSVATFVASNANRVGVLAPYFTSFVTNYGINDLNTRSGAQVIADRTTMETLLAPYGPLIQSTITPEASSSNNFADAAGQTTAGLNAQRVIVNNNVRARAIFVDCGGAAGLEDGLNTGIWKNVGDASAASAMTDSGSPWVGIHPTHAGYVVANAQVNPAIFT